MGEFKLQSPPRHRVHLYVNPYTHDYEITNIPTKYQVQHIGYYVGSFFSYHHLAEKDVFHSTIYKIMDQTALDKRYGEDGKRTFVLRATKQDTGLEIAQKKKNRQIHSFSFLSTWIHAVMN